MDPSRARTYGAIGSTVVTTVLLTVLALLAYWTNDHEEELMITGAVVGQFIASIQFWVGSSASSHQKDVALERKEEVRG